MALDFKQKALLKSLLAEDPTSQQYLYNWNKVKSFKEDPLVEYYKKEGWEESEKFKKQRERDWGYTYPSYGEETAEMLKESGIGGLGSYIKDLEDFGKEAVAPPLDWFSPGPRGGASGPAHPVPIELAPGAAGEKDLQLAGTISHELRHGNWTGEEKFLKMLQIPEFGGTEKDALKEQDELLNRYLDMIKFDENKKFSRMAYDYIKASPYYHEGIYDKLANSAVVYLDSIKPEQKEPEQKAGGGFIDKPLVGRSRHI